jgi:hypothetical protein
MFDAREPVALFLSDVWTLFRYEKRALASWLLQIRRCNVRPTKSRLDKELPSFFNPTDPYSEKVTFDYSTFAFVFVWSWEDFP